MKKYRKIIFGIILVCLSFCFSKNVLAGIPNLEYAIKNSSKKNTCTYTLEYPFSKDDLKFTYPLYIKYISKKSGIPWDDVFNLYESLYASNSDNGTLTVDVVKDLTLNLVYAYIGDEQYLIITISGMKNSAGEVKTVGKASMYMDINSCPQLVSFAMHSSTGFLTTNYTNAIFPYHIDLPISSNFIDEYSMSALTNDFVAYNTDGTPFSLIFMSDELKIATGGIAYVNYAYDSKFNETKPNKNIDPIVEKYLAIDGTKEILDKLNQILDKKNLSNSDISGYAESISEFIKKIDVSLDTIGNDIVILNSFNSVEVTGVKGIYNILRTYLDGKGLTVSDWFSKYMPDSKAQYADSLASILQYILDNPALYNSVKNKNDLSDAVSSCTEEDCDKEEICNEYVSSLASYECSEQTSISIAHNECYKSKMNNFDKLVKECKENDINQIKKDIEDLSKNIDKLVDETVTSYYTKYFKDIGIDIGDKDFCKVLKSGGIYEYIKLALNIIRIGGPILVILLTAYDGIKMIASFKDDENKKFYNHLKIRLICLVLLLLIPTIIKFIIDLFIEGACNIEDLYK